MEIIAHRGASAEAPENTLAAMNLAWAQGADAVELDLWLSKDGKLLVFHDASTRRFNGKAQRIAALTLKEAQRIDVGSWMHPQFKGERIPTLESVLDTVPTGHRAIMEIKSGPEILPELNRIIRRSGRDAKELAIISFNTETLRTSKKLLPGIDHYSVHDYRRIEKNGRCPALSPIIARAVAAGLDGLNLHYGWPITTNRRAAMKAAGLKWYAWTVNEPRMARSLVERGIDGITTNRPGWLHRLVGSLSEPTE